MKRWLKTTTVLVKHHQRNFKKDPVWLVKSTESIQCNLVNSLFWLRSFRMFQKPHRVKSSVTVRNSDRRKIRTRLNNFFPTFTEDQLNALVPAKGDLKENKIYTNKGEALSGLVIETFECNLFSTIFLTLRSPDIWKWATFIGTEVWITMPLFIRLLEVWPRSTKFACRSVSATKVFRWCWSDGTRHYYTPNQRSGFRGFLILYWNVLINPKNGIDQRIEKNRAVCVKIAGQKHPIAIGIAEQSTADLSGTLSGRAVRIISCVGDHLCYGF